MRKLLVLDAIMQWKDDILKKDVFRRSKTGYLSHMATMIERGLFDLKQPLSVCLKDGPEEKLLMINNANEWSASTKEAKKSILRSFYRFAQENKIKPTSIVIPFEEYRDLPKAIVAELLSSSLEKAESQRLTREDILNFLSEICQINARDALAVWMMWELQATIHQVLNLLISDIDFSNGIVRLKDEFRLGNMKEGLKKCIQMFVKGRGGLVFSTKTGGKIHPGQIVRNMKSASKLAKLPIIISPRIFYAHAKSYGVEHFLAMSQDEREILSQYYAEKIKLLHVKL